MTRRTTHTRLGAVEHVRVPVQSRGRRRGAGVGPVAGPARSDKKPDSGHLILEGRIFFRDFVINYWFKLSILFPNVIHDFVLRIFSD